MSKQIAAVLAELEATFGAEAAWPVTQHLAQAWEEARKLERADEQAVETAIA